MARSFVYSTIIRSAVIRNPTLGMIFQNRPLSGWSDSSNTKIDRF